MCAVSEQLKLLPAKSDQKPYKLTRFAIVGLKYFGPLAIALKRSLISISRILFTIPSCQLLCQRVTARP